MAPKRHLENPPPVSTDEEGEEFTDSEQNEEQPVMETPNGGAQRESPADSVSDLDREGTPPSPTLSGFTIEPIRSDPDSAAKSASKPAKKRSAKSGSKRPAAESEQDGDESKKKKKKKAVAAATPPAAVGGDEEEARKGSGAIQRLWSEDDEIAILKGMIEYKAKTGSEPNSDSGAFHDFIKDLVHVEVSKNQLMDKIRRLKKKFRVNAEKGEKGEDPVFAKVHDNKAFELSKKIWGKTEAIDDAVNNDNANGCKKAKQSKSNKNKMNATFEAANDKSLTLGLPKQPPNPKKQHKKTNEEERDGLKENVECKKVVEYEENGEVNGNLEADDKIDENVEEENDGEENDGEENDFWSQHPYLLDALETIASQGLLGRFPKSLLLQKFSGIGREEAKEWNDKWKKLQMEEMQLHIKRLNFVTKLSKSALDALN